MNPVLAADMAHLWFVSIHPFEDGNGRIARALTHCSLAVGFCPLAARGHGSRPLQGTMRRKACGGSAVSLSDRKPDTAAMAAGGQPSDAAAAAVGGAAQVASEVQYAS